MSGKAIIRLLMDRPVAYRPDLARILGGVKCAVFMCQMLYWTGKGKRADGFIWKTRAELEIETGLTRHEQDGARKKLKALGVMEEKRAGIPAKMHYRVNLEVLENLISAYYDKQDCQKVANCSAENQQTNSESTRESTTPHGADTPAPPAEKQEEESAELIHVQALVGEELLTEFFGEKPEREPIQATPHWTEQVTADWATWGCGSDEFQRQFARFGDSGRIVQELGFKLEKATGLKPTWSNKKRVKAWSAGLWELYEEAGHSIPTAIEAAQTLRQSKMTISDPYSIVKSARALAATRGAGATREFTV